MTKRHAEAKAASRTRCRLSSLSLGLGLFVCLSVLEARPAVAQAGTTAITTEQVSHWLARQAESALARLKGRNSIGDRVRGLGSDPLSKAVAHVYRRNRKRLSFFRDGRMTAAGEAARRLLRRVAAHGIDPRPYHLEVLTTRLKAYEESSAMLARPRPAWELPPGWTPPTLEPVSGPVARLLDEWLRDALSRHMDVVRDADLALTEGILRFLHDTQDISYRKKRQLHRRLKAALAEDAGFTTAITPSHPQYPLLVDVLERFLVVTAARFPEPPQTTAGLSEGDRNAEVFRLTQRLAWEGFLSGTPGTLYDARVTAAVAAFQRSRDLPDSGLVDGPTLYALQQPPELWLRRLVLALDRMRRSPIEEHDGTFVRVNIPEFLTEVFEDGERRLSVRSLVGKPSTRTPVLTTMIREVTVNPRWNVPEGVFRREIRPRMEREPGFLEANHFELRKTRGGGERLVQAPGPWNWLGRFIFRVYNGHGIAVHGSLRGHLFDRPQRAYSNGCVNLEEAERFARYLLAREENPALSRLDGWLEEWDTHRVRLRRPIPLIIDYQTVVVEPSGAVRFLQDVYGHDRRALQSVSLDGLYHRSTPPTRPQ